MDAEEALREANGPQKRQPPGRRLGGRKLQVSAESGKAASWSLHHLAYILKAPSLFVSVECGVSPAKKDVPCLVLRPLGELQSCR